MSGLWNYWLDGYWTNVVALSLAHFLWQGLLVGLVALSLDRLLRNASSNAQYVLHLVALVSLPVCFVLTLDIVDVPESSQNVAAASVVIANDSESALAAGSGSPYARPTEEYGLPGNPGGQAAKTAEPQEFHAIAGSPATTEAGGSGVANSIVDRNEYAWLLSLAPWIVIAYLLGVALLLMRLTLAVWGGHRLRAASLPISDSTLLDIVADQARRVGLQIVPVVAYCEHVAVPTVLGVMRPIVLLPGSLVTGLAPEQFAAIISHELVHIRRYDLVVNLLQRLIESLLFFHPVVWYLSRQISRQREVCCDERVVTSGYQPMNYADALLRMAELCAAPNPSGAITAAATGNSQSDFESRVRRLMTMSRHTQLRLTRTGAILMGLLLIPLVIIPPVIVGIVQADDTDDANAVDGTLQIQMAVQTPGPGPNKDVNSGRWQVAVDWEVPIHSGGGPGNVVSDVDGARIRIGWDAVRHHNNGLRFDRFSWSIDNPIDRRDGVSHGGVGGRQIKPRSSWFGNEFQWLASIQLDTAAGADTDRTLVFRARYLESGTTLKRLSLPEMIGSEMIERPIKSAPRLDENVSDETQELFQAAFDSDSSFGRVSLKHAGQQQTIENWHRVLQQNDLTRQQQVFAWWRIGSLAAYNFKANEGETADDDLAARALGQALSLGHDLVCRETLNAATVYATLGGGTRQQRAARLELGRQWLSTRTDAMVLESAQVVNHRGYIIAGRFMPGGMTLHTEAEKQRFLAQQLAEAREGLAARIAVREARAQISLDADIVQIAQHLVAASGQPTWKAEHVDRQPSVHVDDAHGYRITLRRTWKEYSSLPQQKEANPNARGPFEVKHEDWEFVLFPGESNQTEASWKSKIPWKAASSPYHTQAVCMGAGHGFVWYSMGTLFGQETVREKLKLNGGDDRIALLIEGMQIDDRGGMTVNSCQSAISRFGNAALPAIEQAIRGSDDADSTLRLIGCLRFMQTDDATKLLIRLYNSEDNHRRSHAAYALIHQPFRESAKEAYIDMLRRHLRVYEACQACVQFGWQEAVPVLDDLTARPANLRELSHAIPARRALQGNPIPQELLDAKQAIIKAGYDAGLNIDQPRRILLDSEDSGATLLIAIELATFTSKGVSSLPNDVGIELLKSRPRQETVDYLNTLIDAMLPENQRQAEDLLRSLTALNGIESRNVTINDASIGRDTTTHKHSGFEHSRFEQFANQLVKTAVTTLREHRPEYAKPDLDERLNKRIRMILEDARSTIEERPERCAEA